MRKYEIKDWLVMAGVCLFLFALPYILGFAADHARATLAILCAGIVFVLIMKR